MSLPVPNLDNRRFQDIVDDAKRLIPSKCPEWTNHNVSDPGVALIELFAWMTEMTLFRLNQVPDKFFLEMLNLIGFEPFPASPARADVVFWLSGVPEETVVIAQGTEITTDGVGGEPVTFATLAELRIDQPELIGALTSVEVDQYVDVWDDVRIPQSAVDCFPADPPQPGNAFYLGFRDSLAGMALQITVDANAQGRGVDPSRPPIVWEVWQGQGWIPARVFTDSTGGLNRQGSVVLLMPMAHEAATLGGVRAFWVRTRVVHTDETWPTYEKSPRVHAIAVTGIGGTVAAEHSETVTNEILGVSNGQPGQSFQLDTAPILSRRKDWGETIAIVVERTVGGEVIPDVEAWTEVSDFVASSPTDRHFTWSSSTGEVCFGPNIRYADGRSRQHGAIPPNDARIVALQYRKGGGAIGNISRANGMRIRSPIPYVNRAQLVDNATGGVDAESLEQAKRRAPQTIRAGARAVTAEDFERLAGEADPAVARVRCLPPVTPGGPVRLLIVPHVKTPLAEQQLDDFALTATLLGNVIQHVDKRRILGSVVEVGTPYYQGVSAAAMVTALPGRPADIVRARAEEAIYRYVHPLVGGPDGNGWPFDADLSVASLFQVLEAVDGVLQVDEVLLFEYDLRQEVRLGYGKEIVSLDPHSLFLSYANRVVVR